MLISLAILLHPVLLWCSDLDPLHYYRGPLPNFRSSEPAKRCGPLNFDDGADFNPFVVRRVAPSMHEGETQSHG